MTPFPPHSRGWTLAGQADIEPHVVSPALAGMDRLRMIPKQPGIGFPRTRGDGPLPVFLFDRSPAFPPHSRGWTLSRSSARRSTPVSPALAGMDRSPGGRKAGRLRFPRTRGDGPQDVPKVWCRGMFPPHSRGWTGSRNRCKAERSVSPALAGMDRRSIAEGGTTSGFPRTRGDGPFTVIAVLEKVGFPPHSRGWTGERQPDLCRDVVSPALAGMDPPAGP